MKVGIINWSVRGGGAYGAEDGCEGAASARAAGGEEREVAGDAQGALRYREQSKYFSLLNTSRAGV